MVPKFIVLLGIALGAGAGWKAGAPFGLMSAYILAVVGASAGLFFSRRFVRNYLEE